MSFFRKTLLAIGFPFLVNALACQASPSESVVSVEPASIPVPEEAPTAEVAETIATTPPIQATSAPAEVSVPKSSPTTTRNTAPVADSRVETVPAPEAEPETVVSVPASTATPVSFSVPVEAAEKQPIVTESTPQHPKLSAPSHQAWDVLLQQYVSTNGQVSYSNWSKNKAALEAYLKTLADNPVQNNWSRNEKLAYWINAYNAFTIKLILDNFPLKSIMSLHGGKPWDVKWIQLGDKTYSLNQIENDIIRPQFKDARIHFAVNCAAKSCPTLLNRAFTADKLETQLEAQTRTFINNPAFNQISAKSATVSQIFEWYAGDFGDLKAYINKYSNTKLDGSAKVAYQEYQWDLNGK